VAGGGGGSGASTMSFGTSCGVGGGGASAWDGSSPTVTVAGGFVIPGQNDFVNATIDQPAGGGTATAGGVGGATPSCTGGGRTFEGSAAGTSGSGANGGGGGAASAGSPAGGGGGGGGGGYFGGGGGASGQTEGSDGYCPGGGCSTSDAAGGGGGSSFYASQATGFISFGISVESPSVTFTPLIEIGTPTAGAQYTRGQTVNASYSCLDACAGTVAAGSPIDTNTVGDHTFQVTDRAQSHPFAVSTLHYTVLAAHATTAQIKAALARLLIPRGKTTKIAALLAKGSYLLSFKALTAGRGVVAWYFVPKGAHVARARPVLVATGGASFAAAGKRNIKIKLTAKGRKLLKNAQTLKITVKGTFTPAARTAVVARKTFTLRR
jgi:hypothetical protein